VVEVRDDKFQLIYIKICQWPNIATIQYVPLPFTLKVCQRFSGYAKIIILQCICDA